MSTLEATFEDILLKLRTDLPFKVYESDIYDDESVPTQEGVMLPHYLVWMGDNESMRSGRFRGIIGPQHDPIGYDVVVEAVAPRGDIARKLRDQATNVMLGYLPPNSSPLVVDAYRGYETEKNDRRPIVYYRAAIFRAVGNL